MTPAPLSRRLRWWLDDHGFYLLLGGIALAFLVTAASFWLTYEPPANPQPMDAGTSILLAAMYLLPWLIGRPTPASRSDLDDLKREVERLATEVRELRGEIRRRGGA